MNPFDIARRAIARPEIDRILLPAAAALYALTVWLRMRGWVPVEDEGEYLTLAHNLHHHHVFSAARALTDVQAEITMVREPAYPALLAALMIGDGRLRLDALGCVVSGGAPCDGVLIGVQILNALLLGCGALLAAWAAGRLADRRGAAYLALGYVVLSDRITTLREQAMSDILAFALAAAFCWLAVAAWRNRGAAAFVGAGLALAALALTKTLFLPFAAAMAAAGLALAVLRRDRRLALGMLLATTCFALPVGAWVARNEMQFGVARITSGREGPVLSMRRELNSMSGGEYLAAWLYWTAGFGDNLARKLLPAAVTARFDDDDPEGFYLRGARRFGEDIAAQRAAGWLEPGATARATQGVAHAIAADPMTYATVPLLVYRGIWMDRLAVLGGPLLVLAVVRATRRRDGAALATLAIGIYSLVAAAAATQGIPRFQCPAIPTLAIAAGYVLVELRSRSALRREAGRT